MRFDKFTIKSQNLIQDAQSRAREYNNQQIEPEHLLFAMLSEADSVAVAILKKLGASAGIIVQEVAQAIERLPKVHGVDDAYLSPRSKAVLEKAFTEASQMKDEYTSVEHILLAIADSSSGEAATILQRHGVHRDGLLSTLMDIRGSQRITDPNPEEKYQALEKFCRDLTELARMDKLDPVIGRDEEIRRIVQVLSDAARTILS